MPRYLELVDLAEDLDQPLSTVLRTLRRTPRVGLVHTAAQGWLIDVRDLALAEALVIDTLEDQLRE